MNDTAIVNNTSEKTLYRNSSIELLRIIATLFVIILHYNIVGGGNAFQYTNNLGFHFQLLLAFEMLSIGAVNIFVIITGYFMVSSKRISLVKPLLLYADVIIFRVLRYIAGVIIGNTVFSVSAFFSCFLPLNWYINIYIALYMLAPFLNQTIVNMTQKNLKRFIALLLTLFSFWPFIIDCLQHFSGKDLGAFSSISTSGSIHGYTIVNFIMLYLLGAYESRHKKSTLFPFAALLGFFMITVLLFLFARYDFEDSMSYCNPLVILQAYLLFRFFANFHFHSKVINAISNCSLGVYLLHTFFFPFININAQVTGNVLLIPLHLLASTVGIYFVSSCIYKIYLLIFRRTEKRVAQGINNIVFRALSKGGL